jgi:hypothetical protein
MTDKIHSIGFNLTPLLVIALIRLTSAGCETPSLLDLEVLIAFGNPLDICTSTTWLSITIPLPSVLRCWPGHGKIFNVFLLRIPFSRVFVNLSSVFISIMRPKFLLQWAVTVASVTQSLALPTLTSTGLDPRAAGIPADGVLDPSKVSERATATILPRQQRLHFIGFTDAQVNIVRTAIRDAAWMGQMALQELNGITNVNNLSPAFRRFLGNQFDQNVLDAVRSTLDPNSLQNH